MQTPYLRATKKPNTLALGQLNAYFHMKNKGLLLLLGYLLFTLGITSVVMELVGTHWYFLAWLERAGTLVSFILKILMVIGGVLAIVFARTDWDRERKESMKDEV